MDEARYWIGVACREHVRRGVAGEFAQLGHGKAAPLRRMAAGDWLVYYSPRERLRDGEPCRRFTALGRVEGEVEQVDAGGGFLPFRRRVRYIEGGEAAVEPLLDRLAFVRDKRRWGFPFRAGHLAISAADFAVIAAALGIDATAIEDDGIDA